jgi:DNA-binding LacI/PurR family transcriptional regulator
MSGAAMRVAGLIVAVGFALSACTGSTPDPDVSESPTGEPTPAASASASPTPSVLAKPERPEAMKRDDAEGAAAAAEYFIELYPYVMATGDVEEFEAMSHRVCEYCDGVLENAAWLEERGGTFEGGRTDAVLTETYQRDDLTGIFPFNVAISQGEIVIHDQDGKQIDQVAETDFDARVEVGRRAGEWVVVEIAPEPGGGQ